MPSTKASRVLVLDRTYRPVMVIPWERAFVLLTSDAPGRDHRGERQKKAEVVATYNEVIRSPSRDFAAPAVIILSTDVRYRKQRRKFSRRGVYVRDDHKCQYCGRAFPASELTLDHVIPASHGGRTSWDNLVAACLPCNQRKRDRTPAQAGMDILNWPAPPTFATFAQAHDLTHVPEEWAPYIEAWSRPRSPRP